MISAVSNWANSRPPCPPSPNAPGAVISWDSARLRRKKKPGPKSGSSGGRRVPAGELCRHASGYLSNSARGPIFEGNCNQMPGRRKGVSERAAFGSLSRDRGWCGHDRNPPEQLLPRLRHREPSRMNRNPCFVLRRWPCPSTAASYPGFPCYGKGAPTHISATYPLLLFGLTHQRLDSKHFGRGGDRS